MHSKEKGRHAIEAPTNKRLERMNAKCIPKSHPSHQFGDFYKKIISVEQFSTESVPSVPAFTKHESPSHRSTRIDLNTIK